MSTPLLYISLLLVVSAFALILYTKRKISIFKALASFFVLWLVSLLVYKSFLLKLFLWDESIATSDLLLLLFSTSILTIAIYLLFSGLFRQKINLSEKFIGIVLFIAGAISIVLNGYTFLFLLTIASGVVIVISRILMPKYFMGRSLWLTYLYMLPIYFLLQFTLNGLGLFELLNFSEYLPLTVLSVNVEFILLGFIISAITLMTYNLPWEILSKPFRRIRIVTTKAS